MKIAKCVFQSRFWQNNIEENVFLLFFFLENQTQTEEKIEEIMQEQRFLESQMALLNAKLVEMDQRIQVLETTATSDTVLSNKPAGCRDSQSSMGSNCPSAKFAVYTKLASHVRQIFKMSHEELQSNSCTQQIPRTPRTPRTPRIPRTPRTPRIPRIQRNCRVLIAF